ncbi:unnamed protein product [Lactuca virosa]|uniref:DNA-directed DNA polymerase n=1 Tax=Lactuca virosa TaxID=75947 RepID=A0AAU9P6E3_9ASTR|nr:unnamed protein product [Lactuca virosa]
MHSDYKLPTVEHIDRVISAEIPNKDDDPELYSLAHINVEWCNQAALIKYLFKYINKGPDRATIEVAQNNNGGDIDDVPVDEIKNYYDCRYLSACEASWRIYGFDVHYIYPSVVRLPFHLPGKQNVVYGADDDIEDVLDKQSISFFDVLILDEL